MSHLEEGASILKRNITFGNVLILVVLYALGFAVIDRARRPRLPTTLPVVGYRGGLLSGIKTFFGAMYIPAWLQEGYEQYSKHGQSFVLPGEFGSAPQIVLPREQLRWLVEKPDNVLSTGAAHYDMLHGAYSFMTPELLQNPYHEHVIHRSLSRNLATLIPEIEDEVQRCLDDALGTDTDSWKHVNVWDAVFRIVPRLTNRMLVGAALNRNPDYLRSVVKYAEAVVRNVVILNFIPRGLHPFAGRLLGCITTYHFRQAAALTMPIIEERLEAFERHAVGDPAFAGWTAPNDYISWHISLARAEGRAEELSATRIAQRLMPLNFAAIHTTTLAVHGMLLNLAATDPAHDFLSGIREEAQRVRTEEGGRWSKRGLARLHRADSALRESMRAAPSMQTIVARKVVAAAGVVNPAEGWRAPRGALLVLPHVPMAQDADVFAEPGEYDAFRHSRSREEFDARPVEKRDADESLKIMQGSLVTTGLQHLAFGHGRHACPGRFFVAHSQKMFLAYLALNYDIKPLPARPAARWIGSINVPATGACIEFKRLRKHEIQT
ncbi:cytochrome P450 [Auricularia subglabra TFB-10046 SS5]|nr:cytochrome P450 [Auricularia subglabra TFB-10046 SS5]